MVGNVVKLEDSAKIMVEMADQKINKNVCLLYDIILTSQTLKKSEEIVRGNPDTFKMLLDTIMTKQMYSLVCDNPVVDTKDALKSALKDEATFIAECSSAREYLFGGYSIDISYESFIAALRKFNINNRVAVNSGDDKSAKDIAMLQKAVAEMEREISLYQQDPDYYEGDAISEALIRNLQNIKRMLDEAMNGGDEDEKTEEIEELATTKKRIAEELRSLGATFEFTKREKIALDKAFAEARKYNIREYEDNFVAVIPSEFSKTFVLQTGGLKGRDAVARTFASHANYTMFGEVIDTFKGNDGWWAFVCITNNKKFMISEWPGTDLANYSKLGNTGKLWMGVSLTDAEYSINFNDAQNSFILIGGKSRSGKTCLSHAMMIQAVCGGMLPTFLDWKPEGSDLYRSLGYYGIIRDAIAWTPEGQTNNLHLKNMLDALAWLESINVIKGDREMQKVQGDMSFKKQPIIYVWDEMAACVGDLSTLDVKKPEKEMTENDKLLKAIANLRNQVMSSLSGQMRVIATYNIKVIGITQDVMISNNIWKSKGFGGQGDAIRQSFQKIIWGRGTVTGSDCPIKDKKSRDYINIGLGRFGIEENGVETTFRALRIDNDTEANLGIDAGSVLQSCLEKVGKTSQTGYDYFNNIIERVKAMPKFAELYAKVCGESTEDGGDAGYSNGIADYMEDIKLENDNSSANIKANATEVESDDAQNIVNDIGMSRVSAEDLSDTGFFDDDIFNDDFDGNSDEDFRDAEESVRYAEESFRDDEFETNNQFGTEEIETDSLDNYDEKMFGGDSQNELANSEEVRDNNEWLEQSSNSQEDVNRSSENINRQTESTPINPKVREIKQQIPEISINPTGEAIITGGNKRDIERHGTVNTKENSIISGLDLNRSSVVERIYSANSIERANELLFKKLLKALGSKLDAKKIKEIYIKNWDLILSGKKVCLSREFEGEQITLGDIIDYKLLFKKFKYVQQIILDKEAYMELISTYQLGENAQTALFAILPDLKKFIYVEDERKNKIWSLSRESLNSARELELNKKLEEIKQQKEYEQRLAEACLVNDSRFKGKIGAVGQKEKSRISKLLKSATGNVKGKARSVRDGASKEDFYKVAGTVTKVGAVGLVAGTLIGGPLVAAGTIGYGIMSIRKLFAK